MNKPTVYMTSNISPEGLMAVYRALLQMARLLHRRAGRTQLFATQPKTLYSR